MNRRSNVNFLKLFPSVYKGTDEYRKSLGTRRDHHDFTIYSICGGPSSRVQQVRRVTGSWIRHHINRWHARPLLKTAAAAAASRRRVHCTCPGQVASTTREHHLARWYVPSRVLTFIPLLLYSLLCVHKTDIVYYTTPRSLGPSWKNRPFVCEITQ